MAPHDESKEPQYTNCVNHGFVTKNRLARENRKNFRGESHRRKNQDINLRMSKEPEKVLPENRLPTSCRLIETGSKVQIENNQRSGGRENGNGKDQEDCSYKDSPDG